MTSFYYYDQNPSGFCFLVLIMAFVIQTSLGLQHFNMKGRTKRILVVLVKWRHRFKWPIMIAGLKTHSAPSLEPSLLVITRPVLHPNIYLIKYFRLKLH